MSRFGRVALALVGLVLVAMGCDQQGVRIGFADPDALPTAYAGEPVVLVLPETRFLLEGRATRGAPSWTQRSGPRDAVLRDTRAERLVGIASRPGIYEFEMTVTASNGKVARSRTSLEVRENPNAPTDEATAEDHLRHPPARPVWRAGHSLPRLAYSGGPVSYEIVRALAEDWGYAIVVWPTPANERDLASDEGRLIELARSDPNRYPVAVRLPAPLPYVRADPTEWSWAPDEAWVHDENGEKILDEYGAWRFSPGAPESFVDEAARRRARALTSFSAEVPVAMVVNGAFYGSDVPDFGWPFWDRDARLVAARDAAGGSWSSYWSRATTRNESIIRAWALASTTFRGAPFYVRRYEGYGLDRGRWNGWMSYVPAYEDVVANGLSSLPALELVYRFWNTGWTGMHEGLGLPYDLLTMFANSVAGEIEQGVTNSFPFVSNGAGWIAEPSAIEPFVGFLKSAFALGMLGGVVIVEQATEVAFDEIARNSPVGRTPPPWLEQFMALAHVQALFSFVEDFLREGDLLRGEGVHPYGHATEPVPVYDLLPPWRTNVPSVRVFARKKRGESRFLLTAWASGGEEREVEVNVPELGRVVLHAPVAGGVYLAAPGRDGGIELERLDPDPLDPTGSLFP